MATTAPAWAGTEAYAGYGLSKAFQNCTRQAATYTDSLACMDKEQARLASKLKAAHERKLGQSTDPEQRQHLEQAQALWARYTEEECASLESRGQGNPSDVIGECHLLKNARRLMELERGVR